MRAWIAGHRLASTVVVLVFLGWFVSLFPDDEAASDTATEAGASTAKTSDHTVSNRVKPKREPKANATSAQRERAKPAVKSMPSPAPSPAAARTYLVTRIVDGDTIELGTGDTVRLVGIDTPEVGQCGYQAAADNLARLILNKRVRLTVSDEDRDRYGRLLRYVNVGPIDAGLRLIRNGMAIARYDSRDGYGYHQREPIYIAADNGARNFTCPKPTPTPTPQPFTSGGGGGNCMTGYSPCLPVASDLDCADVNGPVRITGSDPYGLDADGDGWGCDS